MIIDLHCHLTADEYEKDLDIVLNRAKEMIVVSSGLNLEDNKRVLALSKKYKNVRAGLGLYPIDGLKMDDEEIGKNLKLIEENKNKLLYIGEVGLDYSENEDRNKQKEAFSKVIELAEKIDKPLLIHSRRAEIDCYEMLESSKIKQIVFHCFTGKLNIARKIADKGWSFSIPASIVRDGRFQKIVLNTDVSQLFTETDSPFLSPFNGRNEPFFAAEGLKKIAEIKSLDAEETENILYMNFQKMFLR